MGVSPELLRAWETRYGLVAPERTQGGLRLYSVADERRIRLMREQIAAGHSAAEAARLAKRGDSTPPTAAAANAEELTAELGSAFEALDEPAAQTALDQTFASFALQEALAEVVLPFLRGVGERWASAEITVAQEHFASNVIGGRLRTLARGWGEGVGPLAVLACPPGEQHELGLLAFGLALRERGWRITYLGAETPLGDVARALDELAPAILVLAAVTPERFLGAVDDIRTLAAQARVAIAGAGASEALAKTLGAESLGGDVTSAAALLAP